MQYQNDNACVTSLTSSRHLNSLTLARHTQLLEILEISQVWNKRFVFSVILVFFEMVSGNLLYKMYDLWSPYSPYCLKSVKSMLLPPLWIALWKLGLLYELQSAFRAGHSTESALISLTDSIIIIIIIIMKTRQKLLLGEPEYYTMPASGLPVSINQEWEARVFTSEHLGKKATGKFAQFANEVSCLLFLRAQIVSLLEGEDSAHTRRLSIIL